MPLLRRKRVLAAKIETTPGTAISLAAADADYNVFNAIIQPSVETEGREGQSAFSALASVPGPRMGTCTFSTELTAGGTVPEWAATFLPACGFVDTAGVFSPVTEAPGSNVKTLTIAVYNDGIVKKLVGCSGTFVIRLSAGRKSMIDFTFTGKWADPDDVAILAPTYPTTAPLRFASATSTIGGTAYRLSEVSIDAGNQVVMLESDADATGFHYALITGRNVTGTLSPELTLVATKDWHNEWLTRVEQALSIALAGSSQTLTIAAPKLQFTNLQETSTNDVTREAITFQCNRSASAGNDELTLTFAA